MFRQLDNGEREVDFWRLRLLLLNQLIQPNYTMTKMTRNGSYFSLVYVHEKRFLSQLYLYHYFDHTSLVILSNTFFIHKYGKGMLENGGKRWSAFVMYFGWDQQYSLLHSTPLLHCVWLPAYRMSMSEK